MSTSELFIDHLLRIVPELREVYDEHLADNDILLPHVFMGEVTRFVIAATNSANGLSIVQQIFDYLESELRAGDAESIELIRASFVENLIGERIAVNKFKSLMGPGLRREVEAVCGA